MLRGLLLAVGLTASIPSLASAQANTGATPGEVADGFFRTLQASGAVKAYHDAWAGTFLDKKPAEVANIASQTDYAIKTYGKMLGWELASESAISPSVVERIYVVRTEALPMFFKMQFYRPATKWQLGNLFFTDTYKNVQ